MSSRTDIMTPEQRSRCMSRIGGHDTKPEIALRKALWRSGLRYRLRYPIAGKPDIVFPRKKIAVFVDGCFWHRCPEHGVMPKTNPEFWERKISRNQERDREVESLLASEGWKVIRVWEHEVKDSLAETVEAICSAVRELPR